MTWYDILIHLIWYDMLIHMIWYDMIWYDMLIHMTWKMQLLTMIVCTHFIIWHVQICYDAYFIQSRLSTLTSTTTLSYLFSFFISSSLLALIDTCTWRCTYISLILPLQSAYTTLHYSTVLYNTVQYCTVQYTAVQYSAVVDAVAVNGIISLSCTHSTVLCCAVLKLRL